jgi:uncharacterized protein (DUF1499 family)
MTRIARVTLVAAAIAALLLLGAGWGVRLGAWDFRTGFSLLRWGAYLGLVAAIAALIQLGVPTLRPGRPGPLILALGLGVLAAAVPWYWRNRARSVPPIHDITTDTADPPAFVAVLPLRANAPNPAGYGGEDVAAAQQQAYPDVRPLILPLAPDAAFAHALDAARSAGWEIVAADSTAGRIEATATTGWFGFKDDVVVRIRPADGGCRIDVRSVSRVGKSDVGANADRIRAYLRSLGAGG